LASRGVDIVIPEIADYEVRRELLRAGKDRGLARLDALKAMLGYASITTLERDEAPQSVWISDSPRPCPY
jgi:hypothetical protein